uniref:Uncharacterized protein n=1 Tax=Amphimedon queenslandica TaxID=400682 RepID=A0A1X7TKC7_AMPQE
GDPNTILGNRCLGFYFRKYGINFHREED